MGRHQLIFILALALSLLPLLFYYPKFCFICTMLSCRNVCLFFLFFLVYLYFSSAYLSNCLLTESFLFVPVRLFCKRVCYVCTFNPLIGFCLSLALGQIFTRNMCSPRFVYYSFSLSSFIWCIITSVSSLHPYLSFYLKLYPRDLVNLARQTVRQTRIQVALLCK